jgi:hypothetical protein
MKIVPPQPKLEFVAEARVSVDKMLIVGDSSHGLRRIVPILGGTVEGPRFRGRVVPGGADWQFVRPDGVLELEAKYTLESHDGVLIMVTNTGLRHGPGDVLERIARGEDVDPSEYYFRTTPKFEAPVGSPYEWMNKSVFVCGCAREASTAVVGFYEVL